MKKITFGKIEKLSYRANESFKSLRTNVQFCGNDIKVIMFTSCTPNEGKSNVCFNLAMSMAETGKKILMIDADLRKSVLVGRYKVGAVEAGLTHYLAGQNPLEDVLLDTDVENLHMIFSGTYAPNPAELLGASKFKEMIEKLREEYDYIFIDCPPLGSVIDAAIVSTITDGVILVIANNEISYHFAQSVKQQLDKAGCHILGAVLNKVPMEKKGYYGKYYGKYYGRYYGKYYGTYGDGE